MYRSMDSIQPPDNTISRTLKRVTIIIQAEQPEETKTGIVTAAMKRPVLHGEIHASYRNHTRERHETQESSPRQQKKKRRGGKNYKTIVK